MNDSRRYAKHNLNWCVKYRPNERTKAIHDAHYEDVGIDPPEIETDEDGYAEMQMHEFCRMYGPAMFGSSPVETEVLIEVE